MEIDSFFASSNNHWHQYYKNLTDSLNDYYHQLDNMIVNPRPSHEDVLKDLSFTLGKDTFSLEELIPQFTMQMGKHLLHIDHPMYFGVFNPNPLLPAVYAESLVAHLNPQLASSASARYAIEVENKIITYLGKLCGYQEEMIQGSFCSGGTEANMNGVLSALKMKLPTFSQTGLLGLIQAPTVYVTSETHHSFKKILPLLGLGASLRVFDLVNRDDAYQFCLTKLREQITEDKKKGSLPLMIVGTLGTTSGGAIDPLKELAEVALEFDLYFHVDAAFGGGAIMLPELKMVIAGLECADSITIDAHKWFSVPMTAGLFITRHPSLLHQLFDMGEAPYMPHLKGIREPYMESLSWSRRFSGLKLLWSLLTLGEAGYQQLFRHSMMNADFFRTELKMKPGWTLLNNTPLPVVCFRPNHLSTAEEIETFAQDINAKGECWITTTVLHLNQSQKITPAVRVGFPNFTTKKHHVERLLKIISSASCA